jgi:N-acetylglucosamine repressor
MENAEMNDQNIFNTLPAGSMRVLSYIQKQGEITKRELCVLMNKRITTIDRFMEPLEQNGLVEECGTGTSTGGRKPLLYSVTGKKYYVGAINISTTYCEVAVVNLKINVLTAQKFSVSPDGSPESVINQAVDIFLQQLRDLQIDQHSVYGVGVSIFSSYDKENDRIYRPTILYLNEQWVDYPLIQSFEAKLKLPIVIEKGTNAAAMLEYFYGKGKGCSRMLYILCAMNIRSAVLSSGELISIAPKYEDAFGHMTIDFDGKECLCGNYGCVDCYTTIPAIMDNAALQIKKGRATSLNKIISQITFQDICHAAEAGDDLFRDVITSAASILGTALANYISLFCPDVVILSGLLVRESQIYFDVAVETAKRRSIFLSSSNYVRFEKNGSFADPITAGAGSIMIETLLTRGMK